jgi:hypothetical protein
MRNGGAGYTGPSSGGFDRGKKAPNQEAAFEMLSGSERLQKVGVETAVLGFRIRPSLWGYINYIHAFFSR